MNNKINTTKQSMALVAGISLIVMAIAAGFGYGYAFQNIYVKGNMSETLLNLNKFEILFRFFLLSFVIVLVLDVIVAWAFYYYFKEDNEHLSLLASLIRLVYTALLGISFLSLVNVLQLLKFFPQDGDSILVQLNTFLGMWSLGLIVFGLHLILLGYLCFASGYIPKFIGGLAIFAGLCYTLTNVANVVFPSYENYQSTIEMFLSLPMALGELTLAVWLVIKGSKLDANSRI
jgi:hypothetical protein